MCPIIKLFELNIPAWHLFLALGISAGLVLAVFCRPKDFVLTSLNISALAILLILAGLAGARFLFLAIHPGRLNKISDLFSLGGGFAYFGALAACLAALLLYSRIKKANFYILADYTIPFIMLSQAFVRMGCFMAGCCYGRQTDIFCGVIFKSVDNLPRHPTQIYEALLLILIYILTRIFYSRIRPYKGMNFSMALFLYGSGRFYIEFMRTDSPVIFMGLTIAQLVSFVIILAAFFINRMAIRSVDKFDKRL